MKRYGAVWKSDGEGWSGTIHDRFHPHVERAGSNMYTCAVRVERVAGSRVIRADRDVWINLQARCARDLAMKHAIAWIESYRQDGPPSVECVLTDCFRNWSRLFRTRLDVIDQLFFTIGNGYAWLDGALVCLGPEDHLNFLGLVDPHSLKSSGSLTLDLRPVGPVLDDGLPHRFYPVCRYSPILHVPDDVRPDWLALAYEAAKALRDRCGVSLELYGEGGNAENIEYGRQAVAELERRFPSLLTITP